MEEPLKEAPPESLGPESTAKSPDDSRTDNQEDNWQNQHEEEVDDQNDHRRAEQAAQRVSGQNDHKVYEPTGGQTSDQADLRTYNRADVAQGGAFDQDDQRMYEKTSGQAHHDSQMSLLREQRTSLQIEHRRSSQAEGRADGQIDRRMSNQTEGSSSEQIDSRVSNQSDQRTSEQIDHRLSVSSEPRASGQIDHRMSSQAERRTSEQIDSRLCGLVKRRTSEPIGYIPSNQVDSRTSIKTHHEVCEEAIELAEQQTADQAENNADHLTVDKTDSSDYYKVDHLMDEENYPREDYLADYGAPGQYDDRIFTQSGDNKESKEAEFRVEPCKFEARGIDQDSSPVSTETDTGSVTNLQAFDSFNTRCTSNFQAKDQAYSQRFPCISSKLDYTIGQEKTKAIETKPGIFLLQDDIPEYQEGKRPLGYSQTSRRQFPPIVYEDPYQVALRYMEKHHILQIFQQITENLVYEKPEDPLSFMLYQDFSSIISTQGSAGFLLGSLFLHTKARKFSENCKVQEMIENRDKCETYKE
ncbi:testis-specific expressed protein 55 isoform X1 [Panthera uncia]|uniref:testis-specific expressed protein 55 isoform X1 n=1 Tax=Panthera uncia TaxID=29064 RepID=UPI0020FFA148|nr:testis-specific expressed protein 55 isoform X1 [Panthera uncia]